jgi:hypothetical protein
MYFIVIVFDCRLERIELNPIQTINKQANTKIERERKTNNFF